MTNKLCKVCLVQKPYDPAGRKDGKTSGFFGRVCWSCHLAQIQLHRATPVGAAKNKAAKKTWRTKNPEYQQDWRGKNPEYDVKWVAAHPGYTKRYKLAKLQRVPPWANFEVIAAVYAAAKAQELRVDHFYPLRGITVSGLHTQSNLQLLPAKVNRQKSNKLPNTPESWDYSPTKGIYE